MSVKIFHKDHGYVITNDQDIIDMLLAKGGIETVKNNALPAPVAPIVKPEEPKRKANGAR